MPEKLKILALIPARGGSKGLPRKNILPAGGRPLIAWTIEAARQASCISRVVLSSDDDEIIAEALNHGCEVRFKRPAELASDTASSMDVVLHALNQMPGYDYMVLLQPTSPLRTAGDIDAAFTLMLEKQAPACVSVCPVEESPYWMYRLEGQSHLRSVLEVPQGGVTRRQDLPDVYSLNGAIYIARVDWLQRQRSFVSADTVGYVMPKERSMDIDTPDDYQKLNEIMKSI
ncbi:MAG: acylneuraminate cytidylyltransferase family protein [Dechloromonas sp.]|uniref:Acylneuraminate cytidylyltransferase family protein n=1 Tax=Candidatus Dechloromonas phosphorivorans TaxID=2899244 RepID=A0A9D7QPY1_9RHOO|nr:acylneuraminate cytidylyltransferase family protein [Candidatus Dechloromonas phosphorivorans]